MGDSYSYGQIETVTPEIAAHAQRIVDSPAAQLVWEHRFDVGRWRHDFIESTSYFFRKENLSRIGQSGWIPNDMVCVESLSEQEYAKQRESAFLFCSRAQDLLMVRRRTTGIITLETKMFGFNTEVVNTGGQRNERKKWIHCFADVDVVLFLVPLISYHRVCGPSLSLSRDWSDVSTRLVVC